MIETERLYLQPLTAAQLRLWLNDTARLEKELNCSYRAEPAEGFFAEIIRGQIEKTEKDQENYLFRSFWFLIRKSDRVVVGTMDFKDVPDEKKEVEIGYGLGKNFERQGYMTEAVEAFCGWALSQRNIIEHVIAETEKDGLASQNVLKRCGFICYEHGGTLWWRL